MREKNKFKIIPVIYLILSIAVISFNCDIFEKIQDAVEGNTTKVGHCMMDAQYDGNTVTYCLQLKDEAQVHEEDVFKATLDTACLGSPVQDGNCPKDNMVGKCVFSIPGFTLSKAIQIWTAESGEQSAIDAAAAAGENVCGLSNGTWTETN
jgi:hypothetical protein